MKYRVDVETLVDASSFDEARDVLAKVLDAFDKVGLEVDNCSVQVEEES